MPDIKFDNLFSLRDQGQLERISFLNNYNQEGLNYFSADRYVGATIDEFVGFLEDKFHNVQEFLGEPGRKGVDGNRQGEILCRNEAGDLELAMRVLSRQNRDTKNGSVWHNIEIWDAIGTLEAKRDIENWINTNPTYEEPNPEGVYTLHIYEKWVNKYNDIEDNTHRLRTNEFDSLTDLLYPGINIPMMIQEYMDSDDTMLILTGEPGLGKTCLLKRFLQGAAVYRQENTESFYVKDPNVLHKAEFWSNLSQLNHLDFLVLDDLDNELTPRAALEEQQLKSQRLQETIVNQLLSYSDGLFPIDTKVLITTNLVDQGIDKALLRPGRCFDVLQLQPLAREYALERLWKQEYNLSEELFQASFEDREVITQAFLMSEVARRTRNDEKSYLIDKAISVRNKYA